MFGKFLGWLLLFAAGLTACARPDEPGNGSREWQIVERARIGSADGGHPAAFGHIVAVQRDAHSRLYVLEDGSIRVFGPDGRPVRTIGRKGSGPGELRNAIGLAWDRAGRLWVVDPGNARYTVFDTTGTLVQTVPRLLSGYVLPWVGGFDADNRLWDSFNVYAPGAPEAVGLARLDSAFVPADSLLAGAVEPEFYEVRVGGGTERVHVPFTPYLAWQFDGQGGLWLGDAASYRLTQLGAAGDTIRSFTHRHEPAAVSRAERSDAIAALRDFRRWGGTVDERRIPRTKPAFSTIVVSRDGSLWTALQETDLPEGTARLFDWFDQSGRYRGRVRSRIRWQLFEPPLLLTEKTLVGVSEDAAGIPFVVVAEVRPCPC